MIFAISGNFDRRRVLKQARKLFGDIPAGDGPPMDSAPMFVGGKKRVFRPLSQVHICLAFPGPSATDTERYVSSLVAGVLGGGATSRLFERVREQEGLAYNVYAYAANYIPLGMLGVYEVVAPDKCRQALQVTFEEINRLRDELVPAEELDRAREQLKGSILMSLEGTYTRVSRMAKGLMFYGRITPVEEVIDSLHAVTPEDVQAYARKYFCKESCAMLLLGPKKHADGEIAL